MSSHLSPSCQVRSEKKVKDDSTIPKPRHVSNLKGKGETS